LFDSTPADIFLLMTIRCFKRMTRLLSSADWNVKQFSDPLEFLAYAKSSSSDCSDRCVDADDEGLEGAIAAARHFSFHAGHCLYWKEDPLFRSTALSAGASAFFNKPFDDEEFLTAVRMALAPWINNAAASPVSIDATANMHRFGGSHLGPQVGCWQTR